jgi:ABC-type antimicrobial peptide transport system permease subunit
MTGVIGAFAVTALLLAACGVYGVVGYRVAQRMQEIAIRVALGAQPRQVVAVVLRDTMTPIGFGLAAGVPLALAAASAIRGQLFGIASHDAATVLAASAIVVSAALVAAYLPARRAPRVDPIAALRVE